MIKFIKYFFIDVCFLIKNPFFQDKDGEEIIIIMTFETNRPSLYNKGNNWSTGTHHRSIQFRLLVLSFPDPSLYADI